MNIEELLEIAEKFKEELFLANRIGEEELEKFLEKHNIVFEEEPTSFIDLRISQILVVGNLNIKKKDIKGLCKSIGFDFDRLVFISYDEATNFHFDTLRFSNKFSDIIIGATPHSGRGIGSHSSILSFLRSVPHEFPKLTVCENSNQFNLNKTQLKKALVQTKFYNEFVL